MNSKLAERLGLKYPILQAPIGNLGGVELAAATSNAGGLGSMAITWTDPKIVVENIGRLRQMTAHPFFVNFVLTFQPSTLELALEAGAPIVTFSWGISKELIDIVHGYNALAGVQVGTPEGARLARDAGADFIIGQGVETGGHVQSTTPLEQLVPAILELCDDIPVVAASGIANGGHIARAFDYGADAVMLGTRFVATLESKAHIQYKQSLVAARRPDAVFTLCFDGGWPYASHRVLRNSTLNDWEAAGCPPNGRRPGEGQTIAFSEAGRTVRRYDITSPANDLDGDVLACSLYAGLGCEEIHDIPSASELVPRLWEEYRAITTG